MLTDRQAEVLEAIRAYINKTGLSPTLEEIGAAVGLSTFPVRRHLNILEKKGFLIPRRYGVPRDLKLTKQALAA